MYRLILTLHGSNGNEKCLNYVYFQFEVVKKCLIATTCALIHLLVSNQFPTEINGGKILIPCLTLSLLGSVHYLWQPRGRWTGGGAKI